MKIKKHCPKCGFPFIYMNDACYCTDAGGNDMGYRTKEQQRLIDSVALEFGNFEAFNFQEEFKKSENKAHMQSKLRDFLIHEIINRVEKTYFELNCSVGAMAFLERMSDYAWIEHGVGTLLLASCEIAFRIDFDLAGSTIMYHVLDPKSEQTLTRVLIAE